MSTAIVHIIPTVESEKHDTSPFDDCFCSPHTKPMGNAFLIVHRDAASRALGFHALYHDCNPETWWVWRDVNEGPAVFGGREGR